MIYNKKADFNAIAAECGISNVLARLIRNRDIMDAKHVREYLLPTPSGNKTPSGTNETAALLLSKIREHKSIRIIGDYDVDGICSTLILYKTLNALGARVDYVIPHRIEDGYGISESMIDDAIKDHVDTILTCDNGISAYDQTQKAKENGITMIVTDHHEPPFTEENGMKTYRIPAADIVVDQKLPDDPYPFKEICGAVITYKLMNQLAVLADIPTKEKDLLFEELLDFAALATICDVMPLCDENRYIVKTGLKHMNSNRNVGLAALLKAANLSGSEITTFHAGFVIGPCINASGRLESADIAMRLFLSSDETVAKDIAENLVSLNEERKKLTEEGLKAAISLVDEKFEKDKVIVCYLPDCHESLAGIIAGKLRERYSRPTFVLTKTKDGVKGSGRSIEAYNMYEGLTEVSDLLTKFGGHKLAAGLSLKEENIEPFRKALNDNCKLAEEDFKDVLHIDMELPLYYADEDLVDEISRMEPFGQGNAKPVFARRNLHFVSGKKIGKSHNVGQYKVTEDNDKIYDVVLFSKLDEFDEFIRKEHGEDALNALYSINEKRSPITLTVAYQPGINEWAGKRNIQYVMKDFC